MYFYHGQEHGMWLNQQEALITQHLCITDYALCSSKTLYCQEQEKQIKGLIAPQRLGTLRADLLYHACETCLGLVRGKVMKCLEWEHVHGPQK